MSPATAAAPVREALAGAAEALGAAGADSPRLDAELLLSEATGWPRERLATDPDEPLPPGAGREFAAMVRRRLGREPVAYILGRKGFRGIELRVDSRALVPRPETEMLVELALELQPATVLDVGTGCGAIALAVADELPEAEVTGTDSSGDALALARENASRLGLERVGLAEGTLPPGGEYELVLANLPYVSEAEWRRLAPEIREHEPREALVPGPTGLEAIEAVIALLATAPGAARTLALEVGEGQAGEVEGLLRGAGFERVESRPDLAGIERVVLGRRPAPSALRGARSPLTGPEAG